MHPMGNTDQAYLAGMIRHHQAGLEMVRSYLEAPDSSQHNPRVVELARAIAGQQGEQIQLLASLLKEEEGMGAEKLNDMDMDMPHGGVETDRGFLMGMLRHHAMALKMGLHYLRGEQGGGQPRNPRVVDVAREINDSQLRQISQMKELLHAGA